MDEIEKQMQQEIADGSKYVWDLFHIGNLSTKSVFLNQQEIPLLKAQDRENAMKAYLVEANVLSKDILQKMLAKAQEFSLVIAESFNKEDMSNYANIISFLKQQIAQN